MRRWEKVTILFGAELWPGYWQWLFVCLYDVLWMNS